jgi:hypothetical protein
MAGWTWQTEYSVVAALFAFDALCADAGRGPGRAAGGLGGRVRVMAPRAS